MAENASRVPVADGPDDTLGFAIVSPCLQMAGGARRVCLRICFQLRADMLELKTGSSSPQDEPGVEARYSGPTAWVGRPIELTLTHGAPGQIIAEVVVRLRPKDPPCVGFDPKVLKGQFDAGSAVLKILRRNEAAHALTPHGSVHGAFLCLLRGATVAGMTLEVGVSHAPVPTLANDQGAMPHGAPLLPFGSAPSPGSALYLTYAEIQARPLQNITLHLHWQNLPPHSKRYPEGLADYYREYTTCLLKLHPEMESQPFSGTEYRAAVDCWGGDCWQPLSSGVQAEKDSLPLFQGDAPVTALSFPFPRLIHAAEPVQTRPQYDLRIQLMQPSYAFGHAMYPQVLSEAVLRNAQALMQTPEGGVPDLQPLPKPPLTPALTAVTLSYQACATVSFEAGAAAEGISAKCHQLLRLTTSRWLMRRDGVVMPLLTHAEGVAEIERCIAVILSTQPGTRPLEPDFGCPLAGFLFRSLDATLEEVVKSAVRAALLRDEPRIQVEDVSVDASGAADGLIYIEICYRVRATQSRQNLVYPYCQEGTLLQPP